MKITKFLSQRTYILLPTKMNPVVYLPIDDQSEAKKAFALYNPFSTKGIVFKKLARIMSLYFSTLAKSVFSTQSGKGSKFLRHLEKKLGKKVISSCYIATAGDKIVLQLQENERILGYVKYPISKLGKKRLINERNAIEILSKIEKINKVPKLIISKKFKGTPFIMIENLEGEIGHNSFSELSEILETYKKAAVFKLSNHPRVHNLKARLKDIGKVELSVMLGDLSNKSSQEYHEVFEHGDFAPWNLIKSNMELIPFDFEYFEECGLEHLDIIKYYFQEEDLLHAAKGEGLISAIKSKVNIEEFEIIFRIFLIKEICRNTEDSKSCTTEYSLLERLNTTNPIH